MEIILDSSFFFSLVAYFLGVLQLFSSSASTFLFALVGWFFPFYFILILSFVPLHVLFNFRSPNRMWLKNLCTTFTDSTLVNSTHSSVHRNYVLSVLEVYVRPLNTTRKDIHYEHNVQYGTLLTLRTTYTYAMVRMSYEYIQYCANITTSCTFNLAIYFRK